MLRRVTLSAMLVLGLVAVQPAAAAEAAVFKGSTAQKRAIRISGNSKSIKVMRFKAELKCRNGTLLVVDESGFLRTPVRKGKFKDRQFGKTDTVWFQGRRTKKVIRGRLRVTDKLGNGARCNSRWVKFTARLKGGK